MPFHMQLTEASCVPTKKNCSDFRQMCSAMLWPQQKVNWKLLFCILYFTTRSSRTSASNLSRVLGMTCELPHAPIAAHVDRWSPSTNQSSNEMRIKMFSFILKWFISWMATQGNQMAILTEPKLLMNFDLIYCVV